jgi:hypothetical protein
MFGLPSDHLEHGTRPCWYCTHWGGPYTGYHGLCNRPDNPRVQATMADGCAFYEREPGVDDDTWQPMLVRATSRANPLGR